MAINLEKGQRINLEKNDGSKLTKFLVGCNWGAIERKTGLFGMRTEEVDVDVDLSCVMLDAQGVLVDALYSPLYNANIYPRNFANNIPGLAKGSDWSSDKAMYHTPDDTEGDKGGDDGLDNEIITIDLAKVSNRIDQIVFFLNIFSPKGIDFLQIPYAAIRMCEYEGTQVDIKKVKEVFAQYDVAKDNQFSGKNSLVLGRLYRHNGEWKFGAIGDAYDDADGRLPNSNLSLTIKRILKQYSK
ncbi:MAG: TerD family protein [Bacteroidales bacterium]|nr:TerD family protein [Bacteroidales bacterium]